MYSIGEKIAELRKSREMTQEKLAEMIGVSSQTISKWENNITMPDILLLPIIAEIFEITLDELFSVNLKPKTRCVSVEDTPLAIYDAVLNTLWAWEENGTDAERLKCQFSKKPEAHTGFVSMKQGGVYADKDLAVTYIADDAVSSALFCNENAAGFLQFIANSDVRKIMKYQLENHGISYTVSSISTKCAIKEENAKNAMDAMVKYALLRKQTVDMGSEERIDIYSQCGNHKLPLLIYPLLSLAEKLSDFKENWIGFRA